MQCETCEHSCNASGACQSLSCNTCLYGCAATTGAPKCRTGPCHDAHCAVGTSGMPSCVCPHGYSPYNNGADCIENCFDFCRNGGTCTYRAADGKAVCDCAGSYTGERCEDVAQCSKPCLNNGRCIAGEDCFCVLILNLALSSQSFRMSFYPLSY